jgi:hypothetical protein
MIIKIKSTITTCSWGGSATKTTMFSNQGNTTGWSYKHWTSTTCYDKCTFSSNIRSAQEKKGITSTFNWSIFYTQAVIPTTIIEYTTKWTKHRTTWHANEVTFVGQKWQSMTCSYYIPRAIVPFWSTLVVGYYTSKPIPYFESNRSIFRIGAQLIFNPIGTMT